MSEVFLHMFKFPAFSTQETLLSDATMHTYIQDYSHLTRRRARYDAEQNPESGLARSKRVHSHVTVGTAQDWVSRQAAAGRLRGGGVRE